MKKELTRQIILKAALDCFIKEGYVNTSMNDIVKNSGISKGGIYWHFKSKEEMFVQMIEEAYDVWLSNVNSALSHISDPLEKLRKYGQLFYSQIDMPVFRIIPESYWGEVGEHYRARLNECYSKDDDLIFSIFEEAISQNKLIITDPKSLTWIYISTLEGLFAELSLQWEQREELEVYFDQAIEIFLNGIKSTKTHAR